MADAAPKNPHLEIFRLLSRAARLAYRYRPEAAPSLAPILETFTPHHAGPGFACVRWCGQLYSFTANQSRVVEALWLAWRAGTPEVRQERIMDVAGVESRLVDVFKDHPAWGSMIIAGACKGTFRIADG